MVDGTPVMDIKPYIPQYDNPTLFSPSEIMSGEKSEDGTADLSFSSSPVPSYLPPRLVEGETRIDTPSSADSPSESDAIEPLEEVFTVPNDAGERSAPEGAEGPGVQVASWISNPITQKFKVRHSLELQVLTRTYVFLDVNYLDY